MIMLLPLVTVLVLGLSSGAAPSKRHILQDSDTRPLCTCGSSVTSESSRVYGGQNAVEGQFPYATGIIQYRLRKNTMMSSVPLPFCGGTLISDRHILTAAHCLEGENVTGLLLSLDRFNTERTGRSRFRRARTLTLHPSYDADSYHNDVGIIELDRPVRWSSGFRASWIAPQDVELGEGTRVTMYGWGDYLLATDNYLPALLQTLEIPVISNEDCQEEFLTDINDDIMICAGRTGHDSCFGDSGGALMVRRNDEYALAGVVSYGRHGGCTRNYVPGVYARLGPYLEWVYQETRNSSCKPCITD